MIESTELLIKRLQFNLKKKENPFRLNAVALRCDANGQPLSTANYYSKPGQPLTEYELIYPITALSNHHYDLLHFYEKEVIAAKSTSKKKELSKVLVAQAQKCFDILTAQESQAIQELSEQDAKNIFYLTQFKTASLKGFAAHDAGSIQSIKLHLSILRVRDKINQDQLSQEENQTYLHYECEMICGLIDEYFTAIDEQPEMAIEDSQHQEIYKVLSAISTNSNLSEKINFFISQAVQKYSQATERLAAIQRRMAAKRDEGLNKARLITKQKALTFLVRSGLLLQYCYQYKNNKVQENEQKKLNEKYQQQLESLISVINGKEQAVQADDLTKKAQDSVDDLAAWIEGEEQQRPKPKSRASKKKKKSGAAKSATFFVQPFAETSQQNETKAKTKKKAKKKHKQSFESFLADEIDSILAQLDAIRSLFGNALLLAAHQHEKKKKHYIHALSDLLHLSHLLSDGDTYLPMLICHSLHAEIYVLMMDASHQLLRHADIQLEMHEHTEWRDIAWIDRLKELGDSYSTHYNNVLIYSQKVLFFAAEIAKLNDSDKKNLIVLLKENHAAVTSAVKTIHQGNLRRQNEQAEEQRLKSKAFFERDRAEHAEQGVLFDGTRSSYQPPQRTTGFFQHLKSTRVDFIGILLRQETCIEKLCSVAAETFEPEIANSQCLALQAEIDKLTQETQLERLQSRSDDIEQSPEWEAIQALLQAHDHSDTSTPRPKGVNG